MSARVSPLVGRLVVLGIVLVGVALFATSLAFDAVEYSRMGKPSMELLTLGWMGPMLMHFGWYANVFLPLAWLLALVLKRPTAVISILIGGLGLLIGLTSFYTLSEFSLFGRHEGETAGDFVAWAPGIFLWTASLLTGVGAGVVSLVLAQRSTPREG